MIAIKKKTTKTERSLPTDWEVCGKEATLGFAQLCVQRPGGAAVRSEPMWRFQGSRGLSHLGHVPRGDHLEALLHEHL